MIGEKPATPSEHSSSKGSLQRMMKQRAGNTEKGINMTQNRTETGAPPTEMSPRSG